MELTEQQLNNIEQLGRDLFSAKECAIALEIEEYDLLQLLKDSNSLAYKRYWKGLLSSKVKHRRGVLEMAQRGSSPAQAMIQRIIEKLEGKNI